MFKDVTCASTVGSISAKSGLASGLCCHADTITFKICAGNCGVGCGGIDGRPEVVSLERY